MKRLVLALPILLLGPITAFAQYPYPVGPTYLQGPNNRPQLSPFLNLLRGGDPAANYYLGTIPEQQRRFNDYQYRQQFQALGAQPLFAPLGSEDLLAPPAGSGHETAYMNYGGYFAQGPRLAAPVNRSAPPPRTAPRPGAPGGSGIR